MGADDDFRNSQGIDAIQAKNTQTLTDIQDLQTIETELFTTLETGMNNNSLSTAQKQSILDKITKISNMRTQLYTNMSGTQSFFQKNATFASTTLGEQLEAIKIVESELTDSRNQYKLIQNDKNTKLRQVEINTYYGDKYSDHSNILKTVIFICILIIIVSLLANYGIISQYFYSYLFIIIMSVGIIYIGWLILEAMSHDNMIYQEYSWGNYPPTNPPPVDTSDSVIDPWSTIGLTCVGQNCCDTDFTYVPTSNKCMSNTNLPTGVSPYVPPSSSDSSSPL
jgi:hypothetical protein